METYIKEEYISNTVLEFEKFCDYITSNKPIATGKGYLPIKSCEEINQNSSYPYQVAKKRAFMVDYPSIMLWFQIGMGMGLLAYNSDHKGKPIIEVTDNYSQYKMLNNHSKYFSLFSYWFLDLNHESLYDDNTLNMIISNAINKSFDVLYILKNSDWIHRKEKFNHYGDDENLLHFLMNCLPQALHHLKDFGLTECLEEVISSKIIYSTTGRVPVVQSIRITPLGEIFADASKTRHFNWMNRFATPAVANQFEEKLYEKVMDAIEENKEGLLDPFISCFPLDSIDFAKLTSLFNLLHEDRPAIIYDCYLSHNNFSCVIRCSSLHTFEDLHNAIQIALSFDDDHLYSFFLDGKRYSKNRICSSYDDLNNSPKADECTLAYANLRNNQKILYLFDYGDEWMFNIVVKEIKEITDIPANPLIMNLKGEPPEQYPSWND